MNNFRLNKANAPPLNACRHSRAKGTISTISFIVRQSCLQHDTLYVVVQLASASRLPILWGGCSNSDNFTDFHPNGALCKSDFTCENQHFGQSGGGQSAAWLIVQHSVRQCMLLWQS